MSFTSLNLHSGILKALEQSGYDEPTPIQNKVIPKVLRGFDIRASAPTGTGKTAAFLLPCLHKICASPQRSRHPRVLILVPTRELAMQVAGQAKKYSKNLRKVKTVCVYGGTPYPPQIRELSRPYDILIATPGRLIDHLERGKVDLSHIEMFVLDEADRMLDMGFIQPVQQIAEAVAEKRQTLFFSATMKGTVLKLSETLLDKPMEISVARKKMEITNIEQRLHYVDGIQHKHRLLEHFLKDPSMEQAIVFTATKNQADRLTDKLLEEDHRVAALHGDMNQRQRNRTIHRLRQGKLQILIATDVAARGIDIRSISHVINFDLPMHAEEYVHRIGRTGRAGAKGIALSFATFKDAHLVRQIEQYTGQQVPPHVIEGFEPSPAKASRKTKRHPNQRKRRFFRKKKPSKQPQ